MPSPFFYCSALCKAPQGTCVMEHSWGNEARLAGQMVPSRAQGKGEEAHRGHRRDCCPGRGAHDGCGTGPGT